MKQWYEELFENNAENYEKEVFVTGTIGEVDFIEHEIGFDKSAKILDIGCGTGRHSIELAKRGYSLTGIDLSDSMLAKAKAKAIDAGVSVDFIKKDARDFSFGDSFNIAIMLCEGGFSLMETDEMNFKILENAYNSLQKGGKLIFTNLNGLFPLFHSVKDFLDSKAGGETTKENNFDLLTFREQSEYTFSDDNGAEKTLKCNQRYYVPSEITWLLKSIGFKAISICGCKLGAYNRNDKLTVDDFEMLVIAEK